MVHLSSPRASEICHVSQLPKKPLQLSRMRQESYSLELNTSFAKISAFLLFSLYIIEVYEYMVTTLWWTSIPSRESINPLSPSSDQHPISLDNNTAWSNIHVMRMNEMITKDEMSWCLNNSLKQCHTKCMKNGDDNGASRVNTPSRRLIQVKTQSAKAMPASMGCCELFL